VRDATTFTKNRSRFLEADVVKEFLVCLVEQARAKGLEAEVCSQGHKAALQDHKNIRKQLV